MRKGEVKYKHLWAWDTMMQSSSSWKEDQQWAAEADHAPLDVVYFRNGIWHRFADIASEGTRNEILRLIRVLDASRAGEAV